MRSQRSFPQAAIRGARRYWLALLVLGLATVMVLAGQPVSAADWQPDVNQTVPPPTPRPPAPTPKPDKNNDNNSDTNPPPAEPAPAGETAPTTAAPAPAPAGVATASGMTAVVQAVTLNVRQGPGTTFPVIGKLPQGVTVSVTGRNQAGDWWNICCVPGSETPGWVSASLVTPNFSADQAAALSVVEGTAPSAPAPAVATPTVVTSTAVTPTVATTLVTTATLVEGGIQGTVEAVTLNVRSGPGTDTAVIAKLKQGGAVTVLGRNEAGDWLKICCLAGAQPNGWVSAQFIAPVFGATDLEVMSATTAAPAATDTPATATPASTVSTGEPSATGASLAVAIVQQPPFAVQGKEIALLFSVENTGGAEATNVALRNELPAQLGFVSATAAEDGTVSQEESAVVVTWPSIPAGGSATATVRVKVAPDVANGTTFANLAAVTADNADNASAGITVGMPPSMLPEFW